MIYSRQAPISRPTLKCTLGKAQATVQDLDDFLRGTRTGHYLYFKPGADGHATASSKCRTPKYARQFEREVPEQGRFAFLCKVEALASQQHEHVDAEVREKAQALTAYCKKNAVANERWCLQCTVELKAAVGRLRDAMDQAEAQV